MANIERTTAAEHVAEWKVQEAEAQRKRDKEPEAMDVYDIRTSKGRLFFNPITTRKLLTILSAKQS